MQLRRITLKAVNHQKEKQTSILIDTARGEEWATAWKTGRTDQLNKGETIDAFFYMEEYNGKQYLKFKLPSIDHLFASLVTPPKQPKQEETRPTAPTSYDAEQMAQAFNGEVAKQEIRLEDIPF